MLENEKDEEKTSANLNEADRLIVQEHDEDLEYEKIEVFKNYKLEFYEKIIAQSVERKYKISFFKGVQIAMESLILFLLMISVVMKANMFSIIYLLFIFRYLTTKSKTMLLVHATVIIAVCFFIQYMLFILNVTASSNPVKFPIMFRNYPINDNGKFDGYKYAFPVFFKLKVFEDLKLSYFVGIGVMQDQIINLILDFINLYCISMYILNFRNPVLVKSVEKIFW